MLLGGDELLVATAEGVWSNRGGSFSRRIPQRSFALARAGLIADDGFPPPGTAGTATARPAAVAG